MAEPHDLGGPAAFMAGVALFDDLLQEAERRCESDDELTNSSTEIRAELRAGEPLTLYARPYLDRLRERPELVAGFAAALGDFVGVVQQGFAPGAGKQYGGLTFADCDGAARAERSQVVRKLIGQCGEARHG
jgi:hypothetical protein